MQSNTIQNLSIGLFFTASIYTLWRRIRTSKNTSSKIKISKIKSKKPHKITRWAPKEWQTNNNTTNTTELSKTIWTNIQTRRSIFPKDFTGQQVPISIIEECLSAANWAPTHGKTQPWRFVVCGQQALTQILTIRDTYFESILEDEKLEAYRKKMIRKKKALKNVSHTIFIIVKAVTTATGRRMPEWEEIAATSCACQNFHLQLSSHATEGVGGYWSSGGTKDFFKESEEVRTFLSVENGSDDGKESGTPDDIVLGAFYVGCAEVEKMQKYRANRGDIQDKVKWMK